MTALTLTINHSHCSEEEIPSTQQRVLVVGCGIAGLSIAKVLQDKGAHVDIIERRYGDPDGAGIALPANAMWALEKLGYGEAIRAISPNITKMDFTKPDGTLIKTEPLGDIHHEKCAFGSIHRHDLHQILMQSIDSKVIRYNTTVKSLTENGNVVTVTFHDNTCQDYDLVIGADGIHSSTRELVYQDKEAGKEPTETQNIHTWRTVVPSFPGAPDNPMYMLGAGSLLLVYPISNQYYIYGHEILTNYNAQPQERFFELFGSYGSFVPDILKLIDPEKLIPGRIESVSEVRFGRGRVLLIGDAAHGCPPGIQQGGAQAFEDAYVLREEWTANRSIDEILDQFKQRRQDRVDKVVKLSNAPMKSFSSEQMEAIYASIRQNGAPNVLGLKAIMGQNP